MRSTIGCKGLLDALHLVTFLLLLAVLMPAAPQQDPRAVDGQTARKDRITEAMEALRSGDYFPADVHLLADVGAVQAVPELEKQFQMTDDALLKPSVASALVRLGDKRPVYWDYLVEKATEAIDSDAPYPAKCDADGKLVPGVSPEFANWAKAHTMSVDSAVNDAALLLPSAVLLLGDTLDPRAIPLLRRGLDSPNFMIQADAAMALADLHDKASIAMIIQACRRAPADTAFAIADALLHFDDPEAQRAANEFRPVKALR